MIEPAESIESSASSRYLGWIVPVVAVVVLGVAVLFVIEVFGLLGPDAPSERLDPSLVPGLDIADARSLDADEGIWRATRVLVGATLFQAVLGAIGLAVLVGTLSVTRQTLKEARTTTDAALRTIDTAREAECAHLYLDISGEPALRNYGRTPAHTIQLVCRRGRGAINPKLDGRRLVFAYNKVAMDSGSIDAIAPGEKVLLKTIWPYSGMSGSVSESFYLEVSYRDVFNEDHFRILATEPATHVGPATFRSTVLFSE